MKIVKNFNTLKAMAKRGLIKLDNQTGETIESLYSRIKHTCYYVDSGEPSFTYKGKTYATKYFSGCFMPFIVEIENKEDFKTEGIILGL